MSSTPDVNDLHRAGAGFGDLVDAASAEGGLTVESQAARARLADHAIRLVDELDVRLDDPTIGLQEATEAILELEKEESLRALAIAHQLREHELHRRLVTLRPKIPRGGATLHRDLLTRIKARVRELEREDRERVARQANEGGQLRAKFLEGLPIERLDIPAGWRLDQKGVHRCKDPEADEWVRITQDPFIIVGTASNIREGDDSHWWTLAWRTRGRWTMMDVPRKQCQQSRELATLSGAGAPVASDNTRDLVTWLRLLEAENRGKLRNRLLSDAMGWLGANGGQGFLIGDRHIAPPGQEPIQLAGDEGRTTRYAGWSPRGTLEGWIDAVRRRASDRPAALVGIYASAAAPLLLPLGLDQGFVLAWDGERGGGKTTSLKLSASLWGNPKKKGQVMETWHKTRVDIERHAAVVQSMPVMLDETQEAEKKMVVADCLYMLPNGSGKGRGRREPGQRQELATWLTVTMSTGELPVTSFREDGGAAARVLSIRPRPFDCARRSMERNRRDSHELQMALAEHHGHVGPMLIEALIKLQQEDGWQGLRQMYRGFFDELSARYDGSTAKRMCGYAAVIAVAEHLLHDVLNLPRFCDRDAMWAVLDEAIQLGDRDSDKAALALLEAWEWAGMNADHFYPRNPSRHGTSGLAGVWHTDDPENDRRWEWIGFTARSLREILSAGGHSLAAVEESWKARGWVVVTEARKGNGSTYLRTRNNVRIGTGTIRVMQIRRDAIEALLMDGE